MSTEENKATVRRVMDEVWSKGNLAVIDEVSGPGAVMHDMPPGLPQGPEGYKQYVGFMRAAFPDLQATVDDQIAEGDRVVTRWSARGTHRGELMGIAPTGRQVTMTGITINRLTNGKVVEDWTSFDQLGLLQQLGAVPAPG